jgi:3-methylfumaryl-CoA hydratase
MLTDDVVTSGPVQRMAATLDQTAPDEHSPLPMLWHWLFCLPDEPTAVLGPDGHPAHGFITDRVEGRRRMYAGGRFTIHDAIRVGDRIQRLSKVEAVTEKDGRTGPLAFLTVRHDWSTDRGPAITEYQDIVYTDTPPSAPDETGSTIPDRSWTDTIIPDERTLFRFSALTFNTHRIHFDHIFTTEAEGYPGLVVHGPLLALALAGMAERRFEQPARSFEFRAVSAVFVGTPIVLCGEPDDDGAILEAYTDTGRLAMTARYLT